jgi:hypothetical protein
MCNKDQLPLIASPLHAAPDLISQPSSFLCKTGLYAPDGFVHLATHYQRLPCNHHEWHALCPCRPSGNTSTLCCLLSIAVL